MVTAITLLIFSSIICLTVFVTAFIDVENRPRLRPIDPHAPVEKRKTPLIKQITRAVAAFNKPICAGPLGKRMAKDIAVARVNLTPEEFLLIKELLIIILMIIFYPKNPDFIMAWGLLCFVFGYMFPEIWLKAKIKRIKNEIIKELPDMIDLLALCVNAGLDFMLALKWVIEKSKKSVLTDELNLIMQEINVGKTRKAALKDLSSKYDLTDVSTFTRTLIQADRMGTSVAEALNILSEDMRLARFRRGEQIALKAPLKMLVPLLFCIFPVVAILVAGPILMDFFHRNPAGSLNSAIR